MTRSIVVSLFLLAFSAATLDVSLTKAKGPAKPLGEKKKVEVSDTQTIPFVPRGEVVIKDSFGEVFVEGWDRPDVELTVTKALNTDDTPSDRAEKLAKLQRVKVVTNREANDRLVIASTVPFRRNLQLVYRIKIPRRSDLHIKHGIGEVTATNVASDVEITASIGEITVSLPDGNYEIDARSKLGDVESEFPVRSKRPYLLASQARNHVEGEPRTIYLRVGIGQINIRKIGNR